MNTDIRDHVFQQKLFDNHEHFLNLSDFAKSESTYRDFAGYSLSDLAVAEGPLPRGKPPLYAEASVETDAMFFSAWNKSHNTGYCRAVEKASQDILGVQYRKENIDAISTRLKELRSASTPEQFFATVVRDRAGIQWAIRDHINTPEEVSEGLFPGFVRVNYRDDELLVMADRDDVIQREVRWDRSIHSLDDLVQGLMDSISQCIATGKVTAFKIGVAYDRSLDFEYPTKSDAERVFNSMMLVRKGERVSRGYVRANVPDESPVIPLLNGRSMTPLHDYLTHVFIQRATDENKPIQVHTGYLAGVNKDLRNVNPMQLVPILLQYQGTRFDLFHAGWPYTEELAAIGKNFPNVWLSLCWAWALNPIQTQRTLDSWLDAVPHSKIIGFGGDTQHPLTAYGYAMQAREGIARVITERIARGDMDAARAKDVVDAILLTNGCELHGLPT